MDSKKVSALLTAIDRGSLTAAAAELGYTQSGLTHMMNSLEDELGVSLLIRSKGGVRLSPTGQELLPKLKGFADAAAALCSCSFGEYSSDFAENSGGDIFCINFSGVSRSEEHTF